MINWFFSFTLFFDGIWCGTLKDIVVINLCLFLRAVWLLQPHQILKCLDGLSAFLSLVFIYFVFERVFDYFFNGRIPLRVVKALVLIEVFFNNFLNLVFHGGHGQSKLLFLQLHLLLLSFDGIVNLVLLVVVDLVVFTLSFVFYSFESLCFPKFNSPSFVFLPNLVYIKGITFHGW